MAYVFLALLILGWGLNALSKKYALQNITFKRTIAPTMLEIDEEAEMTIIVENRKFIPVTFLQISEKLPPVLTYKTKADVSVSGNHLYHRTTFFIKPFERVSRTYKVAGKQRGQYSLKEVTLTGGAFLGLGTTPPESVELNQEVIFLPRPLPLAEHFQVYGDYYGDISVKRWIIEDPVLMAGVREYTGFDSERIIHWPSTLRAGKLMVKRFEYTTENSVMILLNIESAKAMWLKINPMKMEQCISLNRGILDELEEARVSYGLCTNAHVANSSERVCVYEPGMGRYHYEEIVGSLGCIKDSTSCDFEDLLWNFGTLSRSYTTYMIITPTVLESYIDGINKLSLKAAKTIVVSLDEVNLEALADNILKLVPVQAGGSEGHEARR